MNTDALATLTTNMRHAVRNRERAAIGGGIFTPDELAAALPAIVAAPAMRRALDDLLRVTLDAMMADGIALTEQETAARDQSLAALALAAGVWHE